MSIWTAAMAGILCLEVGYIRVLSGCIEVSGVVTVLHGNSVNKWLIL